MSGRAIEERVTMTSWIKFPGGTAEAPSSAPLSLAAAVLAAMVLLSGCNTVEGMGEDVEAAGDEVDEAM
jgi:predicted small secreted protein